mgnify:CR=1 FL=1
MYVYYDIVASLTLLRCGADLTGDRDPRLGLLRRLEAVVSVDVRLREPGRAILHLGH